jgi:hypothetical protein
MTYEQLIAYIDGLYADGSLSEEDYNKIILYILANGNLENSPRDLIQIRRGSEKNLPNLAQGELAITLDTELFYVGGLNGNIETQSKKEMQTERINALYPGNGLEKIVGDGSDEGDKIQEILNFAENKNITVVFPKCQMFYFTTKTLKIGSNTKLDFSGMEIKSPMQTVETGGIKPTTIFTNKDKAQGNVNIAIKNAIINGGWTGQGRQEVTSLEKISNTLYFEKVEGLHFENVEFKNHSSNFYPGNDILFSMLGVKDSKNISYKNCSLNDYDTEGILHYDCQNIDLESFSVNSPTSGWTPFHAFYCENVTLKNMTMLNYVGGGSCLNLCCNNLLVDGLVSKNSRGIDLSNEANTKTFEQKNNTIRNCMIESTEYGIHRPPYSLQTMLKGLVIEGNTIYTTKRGIRLDDVEGGSIQNNVINVETDSTISTAIILTNTQKINVTKNKGKSDNFIYVTFDNAKDFMDIIISDNIFELYPLNARQTGSGFSAGIYFRNAGSSISLSKIKNILISKNIIKNCEDAFIQFVVNNPSMAEIKNIVIKDNMFYGTSFLCNRGITITHANDLKIESNFMSDLKQNTIALNTNIKIQNNITKFIDGVNVNAIWALNGNTGLALIRENIVQGLESAYRHFRAYSPNTFSQYKLEKNIPNNTSDIASTENGNTASRPLSPFPYQSYYDTTIGKIVWHDGTNWRDSNGTIV